MSLSNEWYEYHLTPAGWVEGSEKLDFAGEKPKPIPVDRVLTLRFREQQSCSFAKVYRSSEVVWEGDKAELIRQLKKRHGDCPVGFGKWSSN